MCNLKPVCLFRHENEESLVHSEKKLIKIFECKQHVQKATCKQNTAAVAMATERGTSKQREPVMSYV